MHTIEIHFVGRDARRHAVNSADSRHVVNVVPYKTNLSVVVGTGVPDCPLKQHNPRMVREAHPYAVRERLRNSANSYLRKKIAQSEPCAINV